MQMQSIQPELFSHFADMFSYPLDRSNLIEIIEEVIRGLRNINPGASKELVNFYNYVKDKSIGILEESYTGIFEINPTIAPYIGYHIFGESYKRSLFLVELKKRFKEYDYSSGKELVDHISVVLRFFATHIDTQLTKELANDALVPMLDRIIWASVDPEDLPENPTASHAYYSLYNSLRILLTGLEGSSNVENSTPVRLNVVESLGKVSENNHIDQWIKTGGRK